MLPFFLTMDDLREEDIQDEVKTELVKDMLYRPFGVNLTVFFGISAFIYSVHQYLSDNQIMVLSIVALLYFFIRQYVHVIYERTNHDTTTWIIIICFISIIASQIYAVPFHHVAPLMKSTDLFVTICIMLGVITGGIVTNCTIPAVGATFCITLMIPFGISLINLGGPFKSVLAPVTLIFVILVLIAGKRISDNIKKNFILSLKNKKLYENYKRSEQERREFEKKSLDNHRLSSFGKVASNIAQEINNPLAILIRNIDLLQSRGELSDTQKEKCLQRVHSSTYRIKDIVNRMSKLSDTDENFKKKVGDIHLLIDDILSGLDNLLGQHGIELIIDNTLDDKYNVYLGTLYKAIYELISNAINELRYQDGLRVIKIILTAHKSFLTIEVMDNGKLIPKSISDSLFDPFQRDGAPNSNGLGLSLIKVNLEKAGYSISYNAVDEKNSFMIKIPISEQFA